MTSQAYRNVEKLRSIIDVKDFGAKGDGVTDDAAAIQAALNYAATLASSRIDSLNNNFGTIPTVFLPSGRYLIGTSLTNPSAHIAIRGEQSILFPPSGGLTGTACFQFNNVLPAANAWRAIIEGLQFQEFATAIWLNSNNINSGRVVIRNCSFSSNDTAILLDCQSSVVSIENCIWRRNVHELDIITGDQVHIKGGWISQGTLVDDYDGSIIVRAGILYIQDVLGVPRTQTALETAWVKNYGSVYMQQFRVGGESGGNVAVNNYATGAPFGAQDSRRSVVITDCPLYVGSNEPAVRLFFVPNSITIQNCFGLTGANAFAVGWSASVDAPTQTARLPQDIAQDSRFNINIQNNVGTQFNIVNANLQRYLTSTPQLRLFSRSQSRSLIFDYLESTIGATDVYGTIEWQGYDTTNPNTGRRGSIIGRSTSTNGGFELAFETGIANGVVTERLVIGADGVVKPAADNTQSFGNAATRWQNAFVTQFRPGAGEPIWTSGAGTPEGAVTAPVGSLFTRTDGGASTTLYVKESGTGNTGWVAK